MIGSIKGTIIEQGETWVILETLSGIGYRIFVGHRQLTETGPLRLLTYHHVREDADDLYGFPSLGELRLFELLLSVSGVGPKMAQTILTTLSQEAIIDGVINNQPVVFKSVSGVGQKVAEKIILELKSKMSGLSSSGPASQEQSDIFTALLGLGYHQNEIMAVFKELAPDATTSQKLKQALQLLSH